MKSIFICSNTTCNPAKSKSGDTSFAEILHLNNKETFILIVADGVSSSPKDWLASASTVKLIIEFIKDNSATLFPDLLEKAISHAHNTIVSGIDGTIGMLSTLSILVFMPDVHTIYTANIGDSRIYGYRHKTWHQLTEDDTTTTVYKENGKIKLQNGLPIIRRSLTRVIGGNYNLDIKISTLNVGDYAGYCLVTDGFYDMPDWERSIDQIYTAADMLKTIEVLSPHFKERIRDDASVALLRIPVTDINSEFIFQSSILIENSDISQAVVLPHIEEILHHAIKNKEEEKIVAVFQWMQLNDLAYPKEKMIEFLNTLIANKCTTPIHILTTMIRKM